MADRRRRRGRKQPERPGKAGFLVVDKPAGRTSHDVVDAARRWLGTRRVGHLGTLDPQATGVLPLAVREATKLAPFFEGDDKRYEGTIRFGIETDTLDAEGEVVARHTGALPDREAIVKELQGFLGDIEQIPPMYSSVKRDGVPLHRLARRGEEVERPPKAVRVDRFELLDYAPPDARVAVDCSAGTYVRTLAADLGERLGCGAHLSALRRRASGRFQDAQAVSFEQLEREAEAGGIEHHLIDPADALGWPRWVLPEDALRRIQNGNDVSPGHGLRAAPGARVIVSDADGRPVAAMELRADRRLWPLRVLRPAE